MSKCESCMHLTNSRRLNPTCLDCVLTPNFAKYKERKCCLTNKEKLTSDDLDVVTNALIKLVNEIDEHKPQRIELYIRNWLTKR